MSPTDSEIELECLECYSLINVTGVEKYHMVECHECETEFEYDGELISIEDDDEAECHAYGCSPDDIMACNNCCDQEDGKEDKCTEDS